MTVRMTEPLGKNPVLGNPVQHAIGPHNGGIHGACQHQDAHYHHKCPERQAERNRPNQVHGESADGIVKKAAAH